MKRPGERTVREAVSLRRAIDGFLGPGPGTIVVGVSAGPVLRRALDGLTVTEAPMVAGRTVWEAAAGSWAVAEWPNGVGRHDPSPQPLRAIALLGDPGAPLPEGWDAAFRYGAAGWAKAGPPEGGPLADFEARTASAVRLASLLRQLAGIAVPHGEPESPRFVVSTPVPPAVLTGAANAALAGTIALDPVPVAAAGPGGVLVSVLRAIGGGELERPAAVVARVVVEAGGRDPRQARP